MRATRRYPAPMRPSARSLEPLARTAPPAAPAGAEPDGPQLRFGMGHLFARTLPDMLCGYLGRDF
jgi:hypothetical protein